MKPDAVSPLARLKPGVPAAAMGLGLAWFLVGISTPSVWLDEAYTWRMVTQPLDTILSITLRSTNVVEAAYYVLMFEWVRLAGTSELALRLPSAAAMAVAVWAVARTAVAVSGNRAGALAGISMLLLPGVSRYAQEARPYAIAVAAIACATMLLYDGLTKPGWRWWAGYGLCLAVAGYAHFFSLLVVPGQVIAMLMIRPARWRRFAPAVGLAALLVAPLAWIAFAQRSQIGWVAPASIDALWNGPSVITGGVATTAVIAVVAVVWARQSDLARLAVPIALSLPILLWALGSLAPLYVPRYLLAAAPGVALVLAGALMASRWRALAVGAVVLALVVPVQLSVRSSASHTQDFRAAADLVATDCDAGVSIDAQAANAMSYYRPRESCWPRQGGGEQRMWVVQAYESDVQMPGYRLVSRTMFGRAEVTYWLRVDS